MLNWLFARVLGLPLRQGQRLAHFLLFAITLMVTNVLAYAMAASLFLSKVGPEALPLFNVLLGVVSIPVSIGFSYAIDRYPRLPLFRASLVGFVVSLLLLWVLLPIQPMPVYYAINILVNLMDLLVYILLWTLISDYFTPLELERYTALLTMSMTVGRIVGGFWVNSLSERVKTENLLLWLTVLFGVSIAQLFYLEYCEKPLEIARFREEEGSLLETLQTLPRLLSRYPIISLLAIGSFLWALVWQLSELQFFTIYWAHFRDEQNLAGFLGVLTAWLSVLELAVTYFFTRPMLQQWGISRMNLVYPLITLISFLGLALGIQLPAAIFANINYEVLSNSIGQPVQNLSYNAIPHRFIGRIRVIIDGLLYPVSQAIAGGLLIVLVAVFSALQLTMVGVVLSLSLLAVGYFTGKSYLASLLIRLRSGSVNLDDVSEGLVRLPSRYVPEIHQLLVSNDPSTQLLGLELASRLEDPSQFLDQIQVLLLLPQTSPAVYRSVVKLLSTGNNPNFNRYLRTQLISDNEVIRAVVLESLIVGEQPLSTIQLCYFLEDSNPEIRALACVATQLSGTTNLEVQAIFERVWQTKMTMPARQAVIRVVNSILDRQLQTADALPKFPGRDKRSTASSRMGTLGKSRRSPEDARSEGLDKALPLYRQLIPLVKTALLDANATIKEQGLTTLAILAQPGDQILANLAINELTHPAPQVRAAAFRLLGVVCLEHTMGLVITGLADGDANVRHEAAIAAAAFGESCLSSVQFYLSAPHPEVVAAAIVAIGRVQTRKAEDLLFQHLQADYRQAVRTLHWLEQIPTDLPHWQMLILALQDYHEQVIQHVLFVLSCLGYENTLSDVRRLLRSGDGRSRISALETLASLSYRRFVQPILPLLEHLTKQPLSQDRIEETETTPSLLLEILETCMSEAAVDFWAATEDKLSSSALQNRWIRIGALVALTEEAATTLEWVATRLVKELQFDTDPWVQAVAEYVSQPLQQRSRAEDFIVNRILFLKQVLLLQTLSLDDLLLIDQSLKQQEFLAGETIFKEGTFGDDFYIVYRGRVVILKKVKRTQRELARLEEGQYFGDMALFDDSPRSATAIADLDCTLLVLGRSDFQNLIAQRPEIVSQMYKILSMRLRETNQRLE